ncbi:hypothetical protein BLA29_008896, partial [Euroglyphus maynei]
MSMELHARIRSNLTPDPNYDPIQMIMFTLHRELLDDNNSTTAKKPYMAAIIVKPDIVKNMEGCLKLKNRLLILDYVRSETDLILRFSRYVQHSDPDIVLGYVVDTQSW